MYKLIMTVGGFGSHATLAFDIGDIATKPPEKWHKCRLEHLTACEIIDGGTIENLHWERKAVAPKYDLWPRTVKPVKN